MYNSMQKYNIKINDITISTNHLDIKALLHHYFMPPHTVCLGIRLQPIALNMIIMVELFPFPTHPQLAKYELVNIQQLIGL